MALHLGEPACGGNKTWHDTPVLQEIRRKGGSACFASAGCPAPEPAWAGQLADCPPWPVKTIEDVVREARTAPAEQDVVVRGHLVLTTGPWWPKTLSAHATACAENTLSLALEATVEGACYAIGIYPRSMTCDIDASRLCCDHLPLNQRVAFAGRLGHTPGQEVFSYLIDGTLCRLPVTPATDTSRPPAPGAPRTP